MKKNVLLCTWLFLSALAGMACTDKQNRAVPVEVTMTKAKLFDARLHGLRSLRQARQVCF